MIRLLVVLVSLAALGLAAAVLVSGPGARFGVWDYGAGLKIVRTVGLPTLIAAGAAGCMVLLALWKARGLAPLAFLAALAAGAAGAVPLKMRALVEANPFIHDITTDFENPPAIIAAADLPRKNPPDYLGEEPAPRSEGLSVSQAQAAAFPDILPLIVPRSLEETTRLARAVVDDMKLEVLAEGPAGEEPGAGWRIEAVDTTLWYGFKDDFIVRITPVEGGARVDVRSKSRVGGSDLGANAVRVRTFIGKLEAKVAA